MSTLYYSKYDSVHPCDKILVYVESGISKSEVKEKVKKLNSNLSTQQIKDGIEYDYLKKDCEEEEFYNL